MGLRWIWRYWSWRFNGRHIALVALVVLVSLVALVVLVKDRRVRQEAAIGEIFQSRIVVDDVKDGGLLKAYDGIDDCHRSWICRIDASYRASLHAQESDDMLGVGQCLAGQGLGRDIRLDARRGIMKVTYNRGLVPRINAADQLRRSVVKEKAAIMDAIGGGRRKRRGHR